MVEINLLPQQYRTQTEPSAWRLASFALIPVTVAAILIPEVATATRVRELNRQIDTLNGEVAALTPAKQEYDTLRAEKAELEQVTTIATQLRAAKSYWVNDLAAFSAQLPQGSGVALKSMTMRAMDAGALGTLQQSGIYIGKNVVREIELSGEAASQSAVVGFLRTFESNPAFGVNFKTMQSEEESGRYTFSAAVGVVGAAPGTPAEVPAEPGAAPAAPSAPPATGGVSAPGTPTSAAPQEGANVN